MIKNIYKKPPTNIVLNGLRLYVFLLKSETGLGCLPLPLLFNILLEVLASVGRQENDIEGIQIRKEEIKLTLTADDI